MTAEAQTGGRPEIDSRSLVEFTRRLIRIRSVNESGFREAEAARAVADEMHRLGLRVEVEEVAPGRPNVIARIEGGLPGPTLLFEGHTDVVTEGDPELWSHDPFGAELVEGRIYGRGAADMKGGLAAMIYAGAAIRSAGPFPGAIVLAALCDEEELMIGVHEFVKSGHASDVDAAIVCEPEDREVCISQKGALRLRVDVFGKMAHGAMPDQGRNPIPTIGRLIDAAAVVESELQREHGTHPLLGPPYVTPTFVQAGSVGQMNVISPMAAIAFDIRTIPGIDHDGLEQRFAEVVSSSADGLTYTLTRLVDRPSTETPKDHPIVKAVVSAHLEVTGETPRFGGVPGSTDGTILHQAGIPVVVYGPGDKWIAHQANEYVEVEDLIRCANVYAAAALRFLHMVPHEQSEWGKGPIASGDG